MSDKNKAMAEKVASAVADAGGRTFYVGGFVRDQILGRENKDIDIEVHGVPVKTLEQILDGIAERMVMGASFGIFGLRHYDIDIAMPRAEKSLGRGYMDLEVSVDPFIGYEKAARRRDFTMNALMQDILTGEILDFFGGIQDIKQHCIRHVNDETFSEDPLRVFRAAQFASRFDFSVADETVILASTIDAAAISGERIMTELEKTLLKAKKPSVFFRVLQKMSQLSVWFPEAEALIGLLQDPLYHPEGDVWEHTMQVLDQAALLRKDAVYPLWFMLSALCHDFGKKAVTETKNDRVHAYGHEKAGLPAVRQFLNRITTDKKLMKYVLNMTELHMEPIQKCRNRAQKKSFMKMFDLSVCPNDLLLLAKADSLGRQISCSDGMPAEMEFAAAEALLQRRLAEYHELMERPFVSGSDLIEAGFEPGPLMGEALAYAHKLRLAGVPAEHQLSQTIAYIRSLSREHEHRKNGGSE